MQRVTVPASRVARTAAPLLYICTLQHVQGFLVSVYASLLGETPNESFIAPEMTCTLISYNQQGQVNMDKRNGCTGVA